MQMHQQLNDGGQIVRYTIKRRLVLMQSKKKSSMLPSLLPDFILSLDVRLLLVGTFTCMSVEADELLKRLLAVSAVCLRSAHLGMMQPAV
jgi:hypothetical protein